MNLSEIKEYWHYVPNGAGSYWFEHTDDGSGGSISPNEVLERGVQLEADKERLKELLITREMIWSGFSRQVAEASVDVLISGLLEVRDGS